MNLKQAIESLDALVDDHWTADGLPRMDALVEMTGMDNLKRSDVTNLAPEYTREVAVSAALAVVEAAEAAAPVPAPAPVALAPAPAPVADVPATDVASPAVAVIPDAPTPESVASLSGLEPGKSVLDLDRSKVFRDPILTDAALGEIAEKITETQNRMADIEGELKQLYAKNDLLTRVAERHSRSRRGRKQDTVIRDYLAGQAAVREMRSRRAQEFVKAGTTIADVQEALQQKSKLDVAMGQNRASRGSHRPAPQPLRQ